MFLNKAFSRPFSLVQMFCNTFEDFASEGF